MPTQILEEPVLAPIDSAAETFTGVGAVSFEEFWQVLQQGKDSVAVFDLNRKMICCNSVFQALFPAAITLNDIVTVESPMQKRFVKTFDKDNETYEVQCESLPGAGLLLVRVVTQPREKDQLQSYLQARDMMFTVSRTVSVSEMAMTLAHEINTPIGTISNLLHVVQQKLKRMDDVPVDVAEALSACSEQTKFTRDVIDRIRQFTQARQPNRERLPVQSLVQEAINLLDWHFLMNNCQVRNRLPIDEVMVDGDRVMLQQVILNLLKNAADAMSECEKDRQVDIDLEIKNSRIRIKIRDYGEGLGSSGSSLFVPFVSDKPTGMGIGLNICRSFLELHAGRMWLSNADGKGCVATVELPYTEHTSA